MDERSSISKKSQVVEEASGRFRQAAGDSGAVRSSAASGFRKYRALTDGMLRAHKPSLP